MFGKLKDKLKSLFKAKKTPEKKEGKPVEKTSEKPKEKETPQPVTTKSKEIIQEPKKEKPAEKKESFFSKFAKKLTSSELKKEDVEEIFDPLELILLENNVALEVVDKIRENLSKDLIGLSVKKGEIEDTIQKALKEAISNVLIEPPNLLENIKKSLNPYAIVFFGVNGTGKTTSIAKIAHKLKKENISCVLVAADTFRAASIEQLEIHANKIGVPIVKGQYNADPTSVAFDGKQYAQKNKIQCVLIDTAGRMYTKENLVKQMEKLMRIIKPELKILVIESTAGNDSIEQAKTFNEALSIDGLILSKADVDEKGGTALSVSQVTNKPIYFLGTGQEYSDLEDFKKETILKNLGLE